MHFTQLPVIASEVTGVWVSARFEACTAGEEVQLHRGGQNYMLFLYVDGLSLQGKKQDCSLKNVSPSLQYLFCPVSLRIYFFLNIEVSGSALICPPTGRSWLHNKWARFSALWQRLWSDIKLKCRSVCEDVCQTFKWCPATANIIFQSVCYYCSTVFLLGFRAGTELDTDRKQTVCVSISHAIWKNRVYTHLWLCIRMSHFLKCQEEDV